MSQVTTYFCGSCGASAEYTPGTSVLKCPYCNVETPIDIDQTKAIRELNYNRFVQAMTSEDMTEVVTTMKCNACAAETQVVNTQATVCPFCGSPHVVNASKRQITPQSLLPFSVGRDKAFVLFRDWIKKLWFAPNALKRCASMQAQTLQGVYLPYWTYDSDTRSDYTGERGEHYWETEHYTEVEDGKPVSKTRQVQKTRWYHASGTVDNRFDDVLVPASTSLEDKYTNTLEPWDLQNLQPYQDEFLSGFRAETYSVDLSQGFEGAKVRMKPAIESTIRQDIGGDEQRIHSVDTTYYDVTFKHILLPLWLCTYRYAEKPYRFMINARTGEVTGERPYSWSKITLAILFGLAVIGVIVYFYLQNSGQ